ncbi:NAD(P)-dependent oxidoreductase [Natrononativus amylolyticus]|uniref:NAD(P)-dependent oxidoreductase n=1 Tax=Natrononativus amylolyticus TaxID=2963434 RepID=UPI0020CEBD5F|nr:NAD(P)-dependent oxidoreductase [Natrononativus amylolyticus]
MTTLGFVGLGEMGGEMATHLVRAGYETRVFDRRREPVAVLESAGASGAESVAVVGEGVDAVFLSLPGPAAVEQVVSELEPTLSPGSTVVDLTTSTPETTRSVADRLSSADVSVLGAPVSGGASGAEAGSLTAMVGGERAALERCRPYLEAFATNVVHVGDDPGHGHAVKLLNNYLSFTAMVATSETVLLGQTAGLDLETMCEVFNASTGRNSATEDKFPDFITADRDVGFALELMEKDSRLLLEFAEDNRVPLLLAGVVRSQVGRTRARYGDGGDMTDVYDHLRETMGVDGSRRRNGP